MQWCWWNYLWGRIEVQTWRTDSGQRVRRGGRDALRDLHWHIFFFFFKGWYKYTASFKSTSKFSKSQVCSQITVSKWISWAWIQAMTKGEILSMIFMVSSSEVFFQCPCSDPIINISPRISCKYEQEHTSRKDAIQKEDTWQLLLNHLENVVSTPHSESAEMARGWTPLIGQYRQGGGRRDSDFHQKSLSWERWFKPHTNESQSVFSFISAWWVFISLGCLRLWDPVMLSTCLFPSYPQWTLPLGHARKRSLRLHIRQGFPHSLGG